MHLSHISRETLIALRSRLRGLVMGDKKLDVPSVYAEDESEDENTRLSDLLRFGPRAAEKPWLLVASGTHSVGRLFEVRHKMTVGRAGADVVLEEEGVSKLHAQFE